MAGSRLTAGFVKTVTEPKRYGDGGRGSYGLSLLVKRTKSGKLSKTWAQRYRKGGKVSNRGLGAYPSVTLEQARAIAAEYVIGRPIVDPLPVQVAFKVSRPTGTAGPPPNDPTDSLRRVFDESLRRKARGFKSDKTVKQKLNLFTRYIPSTLAVRPIADVTGRDLAEVLGDVWYDSPTTAAKIVQLLNGTFNHAVGLDLIDVSPMVKARILLGPLRKRTKHFTALPHADVGAAMVKIEETDAWESTKLCFRLIVLTAVRSGEARNATWEEVDLDAGVWTIPGERMKMGDTFRVPLTTQAVDVLRQAHNISGGEGLIFPSIRGLALSDNTISKLLRKTGIPSTVHGFRTSFRCYAAEHGFPREIAEMALAHKAGDDVEIAYMRSDLLERRRALTQAWADHCDPLPKSPD